MSKNLAFLSLLLVLLLVTWTGSQRSATADSAEPAGCVEGTQDSGALYQICVPDSPAWNGTLVIYAHGFVPPDRPLALPGNIAGISNALQDQGYAFAMTSYSVNGVAVLEGIADLVDLVDIFKQDYPNVENVVLYGKSEGSLIATLTLEQHSAVIDGALAVCGPIGDFHRHLNEIGDFRFVFDYFFPGVIPGDPLNIPDQLVNGWDAFFTASIIPVISDPANEDEVRQILSVTGEPPDANVNETFYFRLLYQIVGTNDVIAKFGGSPYDNQGRVYAGSDDDQALNAGILRVTADAAALTAINDYQTSGLLRDPIVTMHTTGDQIIPYWHAPTYQDKVAAQNKLDLHEHFPVERDGHCTFSQAEILGGLDQVFQQLTSTPPPPPPPPTDFIYLPLVIQANR